MATAPATAATTTPTPTPTPVVPPVPPVRRRRARRVSAALLSAVTGALVMLFIANLAGYSPAVVKHETVSVALPPTKMVRPPAPAPATKAAAPAPAPATAPAARRPAPLASEPAGPCPKVGYYLLSHEPTTDSRQYDDRGNWNPGHMELIRECRNGKLVEFPRWVGHPLPDGRDRWTTWRRVQ